MAKIRALVVDDSVVIRQLVTKILHEDPNIEVVGVAQNGKIAIDKTKELNPDIITMDVEMPEMNGLDAVAGIRKFNFRVPIIMFSTLTDAGAAATLEALARGASDYVTKPANVGSVSDSMEKVRSELVPKIHALMGSKQGGAAPQVSAAAAVAAPVARAAPVGGGFSSNAAAGIFATRGPALGGARPMASASSSTQGATATAAAIAPSSVGISPASEVRPISRSMPTKRPEILAIGCSTGGPNALSELWALLSRGLPIPTVIVQHMPPVFTRLLAERIAAQTKLNVREATHGAILEPGQIWIAAGDHHLVVRRDGARAKLELNQAPPENSCRPAVDPLFRSVAELYGSGALAVVLTGMGSDGLKGAESIKQRGGQVLVQDESTSVVWGMPGFIHKAGLADATLPLPELAHEVLGRMG